MYNEEDDIFTNGHLNQSDTYGDGMHEEDISDELDIHSLDDYGLNDIENIDIDEVHINDIHIDVSETSLHIDDGEYEGTEIHNYDQYVSQHEVHIEDGEAYVNNIEIHTHHEDIYIDEDQSETYINDSNTHNSTVDVNDPNQSFEVNDSDTHDSTVDINDPNQSIDANSSDVSVDETSGHDQETNNQETHTNDDNYVNNTTQDQDVDNSDGDVVIDGEEHTQQVTNNDVVIDGETQHNAQNTSSEQQDGKGGHAEEFPMDGTGYHENMQHGWYKDEATGMLMPPVFEHATEQAESLVGSPSEDMDSWHMQESNDTCAIASQEFIIKELTGEDVTEKELVQESIDKGWYVPNCGGTPIDYVGNLLEAHGIPVEKTTNTSMEDLESKLANGEKVIVGVDGEEIWSPGQQHEEEEKLKDATLVDGDANHAVEVIGIDKSDPDNPMVILNDPGHPGGRGEMIPMDDFMHAWQDSDCYMVSTNTNGAK